MAVRSAGLASAGAARWGTPILSIVLFALAVRVLSALAGFTANIVFPPKQPVPFTVLAQPNAFWDAFARYDSGWYRGVSQDGYAWAEGGRSNLAFFPVYPLAMRVVAEAIGPPRSRHYYFAGIIISWASFVAAMVLLYRLARLDVDEAAAERSVLFAAVYPFAFFFGVVYAESTFLALMLASFYGFRTSRWWLAGLSGALAVCTRVNGIMAFPAFLWLAWMQVRSDRRAVGGALVALAIIAAGFGAWCTFVYSLSGSFIEWKHSIVRWGYHPGGAPWTALVNLVSALVSRPYEYLTSEPMGPYDTLNGLAALVFAGFVPFVWWKLGTAYALFMIANLALPLSSGVFEGLGRYTAVLFPAFIWMGATIRSPWLQGFAVFASGVLYLLCLALWVTIHPIF